MQITKNFLKNEYEEFALKIRCAIVSAIACKGGGHIGGSLDLADLFSVLYLKYMRVDATKPDWDQRDYLVCSKGHAGPALYSTLALKGFFEYDLLRTLNSENTTLPGHCDRNKVIGCDATTGSLGQGLSIACGLALGCKLKKSNQRIFCIIGDGESAEGQIWEAAQFASHYKLHNLVSFLDYNKKQIDGTNDEVMKLGDIEAKYLSFGWKVYRVDGSDVLAIDEAILSSIERNDCKPSVIILDTIKGAGVSCISQLQNNHCIGINDSTYQFAKEELDNKAKEYGIELQWLK